MPVSIDEVSAEVVPPASDTAPANSGATPTASNEQQVRRQLEMIEKASQRAARLHSD